MFAQYAYKSGATAANILADLVAIYTGQTNVASLSSDCDQPNSSILTTYAVAGWTVHDASAGTNKQCLKAVCNHDATIYKYLTIDTNTAGYVIIGLHQTWDAGTHTGTVSQVPANTAQMRWQSAGTGTLYLFASARYLGLYGEYGATKGSSSGGVSPMLCVELDPVPWQAVGSIYTPVTLLYNTGGTVSLSMCNHKKSDGVSNTTGFSATGTVVSPGCNADISSTANKYFDRNAAGQKYIRMFKFYPAIFSGTEASNLALNSPSTLCDIYYIGAGAAPLIPLQIT